MGMDDLYKNLKVYEPKVKGMSRSNSSTQNMAFVSSSSNNSTNGSVNTAVNTDQAVNTDLGVSTSGTQVNTANIDNLSDAVICAFIASQPSVLQLGVQSFKKQDTKHKESTRRIVPMETPASIALVSCDGLGGYDWSDQSEEGPNYALMACTSTSSDSKIVDNCKKGLGYESYNAVPPPYIRKFMPPKLDLSYTGLDEFADKPVAENTKSYEEETKAVRKNSDAPIIKEWVSDDEEEDVAQPKIVKKIVKPSIVKKEFIKPKQPEKKTRKTIKQAEKPRQNTHRPRGNQRNENNMMSQKLRSNFEMYNKTCYVCGSFDHLQANCNYHQQQSNYQKMVKPYWNYNQRVNHNFFLKKTHPHAKRNTVPRAVLLKSGIVNTARQNFSKTYVLVNISKQVSTAHLKLAVNVARPMSHLSKTPHSTVKRPIHTKTTFNNSNVNQRVNTVRSKTVNTARPKAVVNAIQGFEQIMDFLNANPIRYALTVNPTMYVSYIKQFWTTAKAKSINGEAHIHAKSSTKASPGRNPNEAAMRTKFFQPMGEERIAKVEWVCVLGCEEFLDSSLCGEECEQ
uniref:Ribonuclease H-like domain-containing protein n=1 Tax=Tanacetum cinerariifolium TaxID=118510 RepID=A0A699H6I0_TANCI|nr:ribonuclease H-like domain-containing protein [Tanacetum cinerariifolium]